VYGIDASMLARAFAVGLRPSEALDYILILDGLLARSVISCCAQHTASVVRVGRRCLLGC